ncbi:hypothetical protein FLA105534_04109 [Flavobacterium bizetiae]|uniref:DUF2586 family protein n=1 Tax=Flavobacterium bizetiae TaxID=2704140 RepID=A0A6J4GUD2_9FLAO|nr:DUF2586 domain-containing protein [Flavobacterium bizetiae]CAA9202488.1 hypothetical protein FLA105534_04109 [Flavobacterium bizetiae]CAD5340470.1 hypothetical protein FLA105535_00424 [Flavobacterium bizetiae]CAD5346873.1 hypothetical protein FLA105534_00816 [Flavobacterium bizetiae]
MSTLNDVVITKLSGGLGRRNPEQDMVSGLLFDGVATTKLALNKIERLASLEDAEALGIIADYDVTGQSAYYQIQQFFRMNPSGDLYIMATTGTSYEEIAGKAMDMQEKANGNIRQIAIIYSGATTFAQTQAAILKAQAQADLAYKDYMPFEIILEGKGFTIDAASLAGSDAENVSVVVAMDVEKAFAKKLFRKDTLKLYNLLPNEEVVPLEGDLDVYNVKNADGLKKENGATIEFIFKDSYKNTAAVGLALGAISKAKVSENIAWIEKFNLTGEGFAKAGFVGGEEFKTLGTLSELNDKRFIFAKTHTGLPGVYFNDSHTCTLGTSDFAYVENNRTINKATRLLRTALLPKLASPVLVDIDGKLPQSVSKSFEGLCRSALEGMVANQEVSAFDVYVDPKQNILATSELKVKAEITPIGTARKIMVDLGFKNPFGIDKA